MNDCPFCLETGLLDGEILDIDDWCYLVTTGDPVLETSVMIIPIRHVVTPFDLSDDEWQSTRRLLASAKRLLDTEGPDGYSVGWNVHPVGGQDIPHAHLHVIGRFADEPLAGQGIRHALKQEANRRPNAASHYPVAKDA